MVNLQKNLNVFIARFQDRWETDSSFRARWSIAASAFALIFLCSSLLVGLNVANAVTGKSTSPSSSTSGSLLVSGGNIQQPTYPVNPAASVSIQTPGANPVPISNASTPTPSPSPTPGGTLTPVASPSGTPNGTPGSTPGATPSGTPDLTNVTVAAQPQPQIWSTTQQDQITNVTTNPAVPNQPIVFQLDFGCGSPVAVSGQLDGNGTINSGLTVTFPACFRSGVRPPTVIKVTVTIGGTTLQAQQVQAIFTAKAP